MRVPVTPGAVIRCGPGAWVRPASIAGVRVACGVIAGVRVAYGMIAGFLMTVKSLPAEGAAAGARSVVGEGMGCGRVKGDLTTPR